MRRRTITRLALAGPIALALTLAAATGAQAFAWAIDSASPDSVWDFDGASPGWTYTV